MLPFAIFMGALGAGGAYLLKKDPIKWGLGVAGGSVLLRLLGDTTRFASTDRLPAHGRTFTGAREMSFEEAWGHAEQKYDPSSHVPDLTAEQLSRPFAGGAFLEACGTPGDMHVTIKAAVQNGRVVGVTVVTAPPSPRIAACIASAVRRFQFPVNPNMDAVTQTF